MIYLSEYAFAKLNWFRNNCNENNVCGEKSTKPSFLEVSLMGISASEDKINYITDFVCIPQEVSSGLTEPTDAGMLKFSEDMLIDRGIPTIMFRSFWAHTHPGTSPTPSGTDRSTFTKWFKDADLGVMYILAEDDDSCTVKNQTKYFGAKTESMDVSVILEKEDTEGNKIELSTKSIFSINKIGGNDGYTNIALLMFGDYSEFHEEWMKELKENVTKLNYQTHYVGTYQNNKPHNYNNVHQTNHNHHYHQQTIGFKKNEGTNDATNGRAKTYGIKAEELIEILIKENKENINCFTLHEKNAILSEYKITMGDLQTVYNRIKLFEDSFQIENLMPWEKELITIDAKSNFNDLTKPKLIEICKDLLIRPICLEAQITRYIDKAFQPFGEI